MDPMTLALLVLLVGFLCATVVCIVALCRAHWTDTVALVGELAELVSVFTRYRRREWPHGPSSQSGNSTFRRNKSRK
ncbi:hypothetical protein [Streptomyces sp. NBC_01568]|uniref:hypothetical protein n=1 Tax=Streptomyces sp. NBC_01568 TaxID=2975882 RepID=UPI002F915FF2